MPELILLIVILISLSYFTLIVVFIRGWKKISYEDTANFSAEVKLKTSVVVCCRNEAHHLPALIDALKSQTYQQFELIWVNDHSTDDTQQVLESTVSLFSDVRIVATPAPGKKNALHAGILAAKGDFIITTDADCMPGANWIESLVHFQSNEQADLIIAPVKLYRGRSLFSYLQQLEFTSLVGSGMAAAGAGMPIFCNAANMGFTKQAWLESKDDLHEEEISGDDVFLLHSIKKRKGRIAVLRSMPPIVQTRYQKTLASFIRQRKRWASKSSRFTDRDTILTGIIVTSMSLLQLGLLLTALIIPLFWSVWMAVFLMKYLIDYVFLMQVRPFFQLRFTLVDVFLLSLLYPFYLVGIGLSALLKKNRQW